MGKKNKSISTVVILIVACVMLSFAANQSGMKEIIMAKDATCFDGTNLDEAIVQQMVDATVAELVGIPDNIPFAYENLFPYGGLSANTKIAIKINPNAAATTTTPVANALKNGLAYMLDHTFPKDNITIVADEGSPSTDTVDINSLKYVVKDAIADADFIIYLASALGTDLACGVDMALNLMTSSIEGVGGADMTQFYALAQDETTPSLSLLNAHPTFIASAGKVVLYMLDLLSYSGTGNEADLAVGNMIYATTNITVLDWKGLQFLADSVSALTAQQTADALKVCSLSVSPIALGIINDGQILEIPVGPPWNIVGINSNVNSVSNYNIQVKATTSRTMFNFSALPANTAKLSIFDSQGRTIWTQETTEKKIVWNNSDLRGNSVPSGLYIYELTSGKVKVRGKTSIKK